LSVGINIARKTRPYKPFDENSQRIGFRSLTEPSTFNLQLLFMQAEHILQERYQLKQKIGQNAGHQTWLASDIQASPPSPVILKLLALIPRCSGMN
jgi:hypothetical protein